MMFGLSRQLDRESTAALLKTLVFLIGTGAATFFMINILANGLFRDDTQYKAVFTDATNVSMGDDVRIAGVSVGSVHSLDLLPDGRALVTFGVDSDVPLTTNTEVTIRYRNLVGQRYVALSQSPGGTAARLGAGATIPLDRTHPALDLNTLFQGFKPVFRALSPEDTNKLAFEIVQTLQGESGTVRELLGTTGSLTQTLADHDQLIGDVITNLSKTLQTVANRDTELGDTIESLRAFVHGLNTDRATILGSIDSISALSSETADLLRQGRPSLAADIKALREATQAYGSQRNLDALQQDLQILPYKMRKLTAVASGSSQFDFYVCSLNGSIQVGAVSVPFDTAGLPVIGGPRCTRGDR